MKDEKLVYPVKRIKNKSDFTFELSKKDDTIKVTFKTDKLKQLKFLDKFKLRK